MPKPHNDSWPTVLDSSIKKEFEEIEVEDEEEEIPEEVEEEEEKAEDTTRKLESEGHGEDLKLVSSNPVRSESNHAPPNEDGTHGILVAKIEEAADVNVAGAQSEVQDKHISFEEKGCSISIINDKEITVSLKNKCDEDSDHVHSFNLKPHGSQETHFSSGASFGSEITRPLHVHSEELSERHMAECGTIIGTTNGTFEKEIMQIYQKPELQKLEGSSLSRVHILQRRPRSGSPDTTLKNVSKRPAIVCEFYARGWCIKGNSCRFLHQKEGSNENLAKPSRKGDVLDVTGLVREAENVSTLQEQPDSSNRENSSKSQLQIQKSLIRADGENHELPRFHDEHNIHAVEEYHKGDIPRDGNILTQQEYNSPLVLGPQSDMSVSGQLLSRRHLHEEQLQREMPKKESPSDSLLPRSSSLMSSAFPENKYNSSSSSATFGPYNSFITHDRRTEEFALQNHQSTFQVLGSHSSHGFGVSTFSSSYRSSSCSFERFNISENIDFDKGYCRSRSSSLPRSSSPYSRHEAEYGQLQDVPASVWQKREIQGYSWEPSVPFRPSFHYAPASLSSPNSQYDPLIDSIEPRNTGNLAMYGTQMPGYGMEKTVGSFSQPFEGILDIGKPVDGLSRQTSLAEAPRDAVVDGASSSIPTEEKQQIPDPLAESTNVSGVEHNGDFRHQGEKSGISKESKSMKIFRVALVEFVKELVKPSWREGHLSKDAHKMVVKKAVEKVLSALQAHQIPNGTESIKQYLSTSRPKLLKLVEGYVGKYAKS